MSKFWRTAVITLFLVLATSLLTKETAVAVSKLPSSCYIKLDVTWKIGTRGYGGFTNIEMQGVYEVVSCGFLPQKIKDKYLACIDYVSGRIVQASGAFHKEQAIYADGDHFPGGLKVTEAMPLGRGVIRRSKDGSAEIVLSGGPGIKMVNDAAQEAAGCWGDWPELRISSSMFRDLHKLHIKRTEPVSIPSTDCQGEMTVEISGRRQVRKGTLPDPNDPTVTAFDCANQGGFVTEGSVWCIAGDFGCYRIKPEGEKKPKGKIKSK